MFNKLSDAEKKEVIADFVGYLVVPAAAGLLIFLWLYLTGVIEL
jgi:hypothetical protein